MLLVRMPWYLCLVGSISLDRVALMVCVKIILVRVLSELCVIGVDMLDRKALMSRERVLMVWLWYVRKASYVHLWCDRTLRRVTPWCFFQCSVCDSNADIVLWVDLWKFTFGVCEAFLYMNFSVHALFFTCNFSIHALFYTCTFLYVRARACICVHTPTVTFFQWCSSCDFDIHNKNSSEKGWGTDDLLEDWNAGREKDIHANFWVLWTLKIPTHFTTSRRFRSNSSWSRSFDSCRWLDSRYGCTFPRYWIRVHDSSILDLVALLR